MYFPGVGEGRGRFSNTIILTKVRIHRTARAIVHAAKWILIFVRMTVEASDGGSKNEKGPAGFPAGPSL
ncbi:hypothetical protein [Sphingomonas sp. GB1N7]|uniref:hypothetical protein n=1 Tax=Parasphingomonas caseinilytica TaxID=3096158 RepID=UPI002FC60711